MIFTRGRRRHVDTTGHFCPQATCAYHGRVGWGNIRANGHPNGRRWRQLVCLGCQRHFLETYGTPLHGKQVEPDTLVWAIAALAEGLGIRAVARVFETDPNTVLGWLVEAADHLEAFSHHFLRDVDVEQVQMDELFALLRAVKDGEVSEAASDQAPVAITALGLGGDGPRMQADPGRGRRGSDPGHGATPGASGHPGADAGLRPAISHRRLSRISHRAGHALRPLDAIRAPP